MHGRPQSLEGTGEIKLRRLVEEALRMRPSRIVVGEVRQEESLGANLRSLAGSGPAEHEQEGCVVGPVGEAEEAVRQRLEWFRDMEAGEDFDQSSDADVDRHVTGLDQAVGVAEQQAASWEGKLDFLVTVDAQAERHAWRCVKLAHHSVRVAQQEGWMPGVGHPELTIRRWVVDRVDGGGELRWHGVWGRGGRQVNQVVYVAVQDAENLGRPEVGYGGSAHPGACLAHQDGRRYPTAADVAEAKPDTSAANLVDLPPVSSDLDVIPAGDVARRDLEAWQSRWPAGQQSALQAQGDLSLLLIC